MNLTKSPDSKSGSRIRKKSQNKSASTLKGMLSVDKYGEAIQPYKKGKNHQVK